MIQLAFTDSGRPVDARWQVAQAIVDKHATRHDFRRVMDEYVEQAVRYIVARGRCGGDEDVRRLADRMPQVHAAYVLRNTDDKLARGLVEARLLAGLTVAETAAACNVRVEILQWYEALFFRVVGLRQHRNYILCEAFPNAFWANYTEDDVDVHLKRAGFLKGPLLVDLVERYYRYDWSVITNVANLSRAEIDELSQMIMTEALILTWVQPIERMQRVFNLCELSQELHRLAALPTDTSPGDPILGHVISSSDLTKLLKNDPIPPTAKPADSVSQVG
jgi:hypothetical protein